MIREKRAAYPFEGVVALFSAFTLFHTGYTDRIIRKLISPISSMGPLIRPS